MLLLYCSSNPPAASKHAKKPCHRNTRLLICIGETVYEKSPQSLALPLIETLDFFGRFLNIVILEEKKEESSW